MAIESVGEENSIFCQDSKPAAIESYKEPAIETQTNDHSFINGKCDDHQEKSTEAAATSNMQQNPTVEIFSKLNPMAQEFVPAKTIRKKKKNSYYGNQRRNTRTSMAQRVDKIRKTLHIPVIDHQVTEVQLANLFVHVGHVVDCRICSNPNISGHYFAFVEFSDEEAANTALKLSGISLGSYPLRLEPSRTGIVPVNSTLLPRSEEEYDMCTRTVYCTNIDKQVKQENVRLFFECCCGEVERLRVLQGYDHAKTCIAFVEFREAESAIAALKLSGALLGSLPISVNPSKTPLRPLVG